MVVSVTDEPRLSMTAVKNIAAAVLVLFALWFYFYGPSVTPLMHSSATAECNELAGGNYRSYRLDWVVGVTPHWECYDRSTPTEPPVDLGWWEVRR